MPYGHHAAALGTPSRMYDSAVADGADQDLGSPLALDLTKISGGTTSRGASITDAMAVSQFVEKPSTANAALFAGVAETAMVRGAMTRYIWSGPCKARVHNVTAAGLTLEVGSPLVQVPGQAYFTPVLRPNHAGTALATSRRAGKIRAIVRKQITIAANTTTEADIFLFPPTDPVIETFSWFAAAAPSGTSIADMVLGVARGPGFIAAAGIGVTTGGNAGSLELNVKIKRLGVAAASIFSSTELPKVVNDCVDPCHSLHDTAAPAAAASLGTGGRYGTIDATKIWLAPGDLILFSVTNASSNNGTGVQVQVDVAYF